MRKFLMRLFAVSWWWAFACGAATWLSAADTPEAIFGEAVAAWHMATAADAAGAKSDLKARGVVRWGVPLAGDEAAQSKARGGDGQVAEFTGEGWLDAGQGAADELRLRGDAVTVLVRLRVPSGIWETRGLLSKGGGHDQLVVNLFSHDFGQGPEIGFELGIVGKPGLGGQVRTRLARVGEKEWHDVVARYDGRELSLWIDGVPLDRKPVSGSLRTDNAEPLALGAGTSGGHVDSPLVGQIDHAAIWARALTDEQIVTLTGGVDETRRRAERYLAWKPTTGPRPAPTAELLAAARELHSRFQRDPHRPRWHFMAPEEGDCMPFDPNGAIYWKGRYHLFYIFQRRQTQTPQLVHCWGHASSADLLHWVHHPTALDVATGDPDQGIFSGNAFLDRNGVPTIMYHGVGIGNCIATAQDDDLTQWKKSERNPVVAMPKPGDPNHGEYESWDPHGWWERSAAGGRGAGTYYAIFGGATAALFSGPELDQLRYRGPLLPRDPWAEPGEDLSCPDFFALGSKQMLLCISHRRGARYYLGAWSEGRFTPERHGRMNWPGGCFFAPETLVDERGRRILWGWAFDHRSDAARQASGWSGVMSLPRVLSLDEHGELRIEPIAELARLRSPLAQVESLRVPTGADVSLGRAQGDSLEWQLEFAPPADRAEALGVVLRKSPDSAEETRVEYRPKEGELRIEFGRSSLDPTIRYKTWFFHPPLDPEETPRRPSSQVAPFRLAAGEPLRLRIYLDRSLLEVFANDRLCLTQRIYPTRADSLGTAVFARGAEAVVRSGQVWKMADTNPR